MTNNNGNSEGFRADNIRTRARTDAMRFLTEQRIPNPSEIDSDLLLKLYGDVIEQSLDELKIGPTSSEEIAIYLNEFVKSIKIR